MHFPVKKTRLQGPVSLDRKSRQRRVSDTTQQSEGIQTSTAAPPRVQWQKPDSTSEPIHVPAQQSQQCFSPKQKQRVLNWRRVTATQRMPCACFPKQEKARLFPACVSRTKQEQEQVSPVAFPQMQSPAQTERFLKNRSVSTVFPKNRINQQLAILCSKKQKLTWCGLPDQEIILRFNPSDCASSKRQLSCPALDRNQHLSDRGSEAIVILDSGQRNPEMHEFVVLTQNRMPQATVNAAEGFTPVVNAPKQRGFYPRSDRVKGDLFPCSVSSRSSDSRELTLSDKNSFLPKKRL